MIFSVIGILTILSTSYDLVQKILLQNGELITNSCYHYQPYAVRTAYLKRLGFVLSLTLLFMYISDPKLSHPLYTSFSVYTNGRRLMTFTSTPMTLHCLDGIRALAMAWVIVGHSFGSEVAISNPIHSFTVSFCKFQIYFMHFV